MTENTNQDSVHFLAERWKSASLRPGETVLLHSNIIRTTRTLKKLKIPVSAEIILDSFLKALGPEGTLVLPIFNWDFTKGVPFNIRSTPSQVGALTEAGRLHPNAVRTGHPIYSFAAIGHNAKAFQNIDNQSGYGPDSPFATLRQLDGRVAVLDLPDQHAMTFYHHVEELLNVPYRYHKNFTAPYTRSNGETSDKTYSLFVRDLEKGVVTHVHEMEKLLWRQKLYQGHQPGHESGLRLVDANALFEFTANIIRDGKAEGLLYIIDKSK